MNQKFIAAFCNVQKEICRDVEIIFRKRFAAKLQRCKEEMESFMKIIISMFSG